MTPPRGLPSERSFGLSIGTVCLVGGALAWRRAHVVSAAVLAATGVVLIACALVAPAALRWSNRIWWRIAQVLGWVNARILLSVFFVIVMTPAGLLMRMLGRNPLSAANPRSGWSTYSVRRANPKHYEQMF